MAAYAPVVPGAEKIYLMEENTAMDQKVMVDRETLGYLERQVHNMGKLVEINGIINSTLDIGKLLTIIMEIIKDIMKTEASTLLLYEEHTRDLVFKVALGEAGQELQEKYRVKIGQGIAGWVAQERKEVFINDVYSDSRFDPNFDKKTGFVTKSIICTPLLFKGKLLGVIQAINPLNKPGFDEEDAVLFKAFANQAVLAVQNAIFFQNAIEEERIRSELDAAHSIQNSLFPVITNDWGNVSIAARSISAREVGGEFYDIFYFDKALGFALGDIHTRGIPGSLQASIVNGAIKAYASVRGQSPRYMHTRIDTLLKDNIHSVNTLSLFYGVISFEENMLRFVNSGVAYPVFVRNGRPQYIKIGGSSLGDGDLDLKKVKIQLRPGDLFVIVTDGLIKQKNRNAQQMGLKRVVDFLGKDFGSPEDVVDSLMDFADDFTGGLEKKEDITIIAMKING